MHDALHSMKEKEMIWLMKLCMWETVDSSERPMHCSSVGMDVGHSPRNVHYPVRMFQRNSASPTTRIPLRPLAHQSADSEMPGFTSWVVLLRRTLKLILHNWQRHVTLLVDSSTPGIWTRFNVIPLSGVKFSPFVCMRSRVTLKNIWNVGCRIQDE